MPNDSDTVTDNDRPTRADALRLLEAGGPVAPADLDRLWTRSASVRPDELVGRWRGSTFDTGHPAQALLARLRWYGKTFHADGRVDPIVCRGEDGALFADVAAAKGGASVWMVEFRGESTATMIYDGQPILDHFKRIDDNTLLGIMNGIGVLHEGAHYYFLLERD